MGIACGILELACKSVPLLVDQPAKNKNKIIKNQQQRELLRGIQVRLLTINERQLARETMNECTSKLMELIITKLLKKNKIENKTVSNN